FLTINSETGNSAGVRRIEAVTGECAMAWVESLEKILDQSALPLKCNRESVPEKVQQSLLKIRNLEKELQQVRTPIAKGFVGADLTEQVQEIKGVKVLAVKVPVADPKTLRETIDTLKNKLKTAVV